MFMTIEKSHSTNCPPWRKSW